MTNKKKMPLVPIVSVLGALALTLFIFIAVVHNASNERFTVVFFEEVIRPGYETAPAVAQVNVSPDLAWAKVPVVWKVAGWVMLAATWIAVWFVSTGRHMKRKLNDPQNESLGKALLIVVVPLILCLASFFGGYSSKLVSNYVEVPKERFDYWVEFGLVEKKGERTYVDMPGAEPLNGLFVYKNYIK